jgi:hypothetical protein
MAAVALLVWRWRGVPPLFTAYRGWHRPGLPQHQVADFLVDCADIWAQSDASDKNPLYWLRGLTVPIVCAGAGAGGGETPYDDDSWQDAFKRGILLADAKITPDERRDWWPSRIPSARKSPFRSARCISSGATGRPVSCSWWRSAPATRSCSSPAIANWRRCASRSSAAQQLELTTRKLENLTDIERQLSSRKPGGNFRRSEKVPEVIHDDP